MDVLSDVLHTVRFQSMVLGPPIDNRGMHRVILALLLSAILASCASPKTCEQRADEEYHRCQMPAVGVSHQEGPAQPVTGPEAQSCQTSHQRALEECSGGPTPPVPDIHPDAG